MNAALKIMMTKSEATAITTQIRLQVDTIVANTEKLVSLIEQAKAGEAWRALEYPSWTAYVAAEFSGSLKSLEQAERVPVVLKLSETGMSARAIAPVVGVGKSTVDRDLQVSHAGTPAEKAVVDAAEKVTGTDGKSYPRRATFLPSGKPDARSTEDMAGAVPPVQPKPRQRPLPDAYWHAMYDLEKVVDRLVRLTDDDRFARNADNLYDRHGNKLQQVCERLHDQVAMPLVRGGGADD